MKTYQIMQIRYSNVQVLTLYYLGGIYGYLRDKFVDQKTIERHLLIFRNSAELIGTYTIPSRSTLFFQLEIFSQKKIKKWRFSFISVHVQTYKNKNRCIKITKGCCGGIHEFLFPSIMISREIILHLA